MRNKDVKWQYVPLLEEKERVRNVEWELMLSWDKVFHTVQWEWPFIGYPMAFVRLNWCNLSCSFCDTPYTFRKDMKEYYEAESLSVRKVLKMIWKSDFVITWWEPLLQYKSIEALLKLVESTRLVQIETNWTIAISNYILKRCSIVCSPKIAYKSLYQRKNIEVLNNSWAYFKFVCADEVDFYKIASFVSEYKINKKKVYIMPEWITVEDNQNAYKKFRDLLIKEWFKTTPRLQNIMWDWAIRWV